MAKKKKVEPVIEPVDTTDAEIAALEAEMRAAEAVAEAVLMVEDAAHDYVEVEGGGRVSVHPDQKCMFRVLSLDGRYFDHCSNTPDGEWVYRRTK